MDASQPSPAGVPLGQKLAYAAGNTATIVGKQAPKGHAYQIYNIELGVSPDRIGMVIALSRLWDAIADPIMGAFSDRFTSRWGRRVPFIFAGSILSGIAFALLWWFPAGRSDGFYLAWFAVCAILFYTTFAIYAVPWYALGYELTADYDERTRIMAYAQVFNAVALVIVSWLYFFVQQFDDVFTGIRWVGTVTGIGITVFGLIPAFFNKERFAKS